MIWHEINALLLKKKKISSCKTSICLQFLKKLQCFRSPFLFFRSRVPNLFQCSDCFTNNIKKARSLCLPTGIISITKDISLYDANQNLNQYQSCLASQIKAREGDGTPLVLSPGKSHGWRSLVGCSPWGLEELDTTERLHFQFFTFHFHALEKEMATLSSVLAWRIPGRGEPSGLLSMGSHRVGHD